MSTTRPIAGLHHVTAIASDARRNLDFHARGLGLRLVKRTVNFDDPGTYHFYFGDEPGQPGTILTFFPWQYAKRGRAGSGETTATAFAAPAASRDWWRARLDAIGAEAGEPFERFGETVLPFRDPDGMALEIVGREATDPRVRPWTGADVPAEHALRGFDGVTLTVNEEAPTARLLERMGYAEAARSEDRVRFVAAADDGAEVVGGRLDLLLRPSVGVGSLGAGSVHHIAFRVRDDDDQLAWRKAVAKHGLHPTPPLDRQYFRSVYFREPNGVLFELATDPPGFTLDEPVESLGQALKLPDWLEPERPRIERVLPAIEVPGGSPAASAEGDR